MSKKHQTKKTGSPVVAACVFELNVNDNAVQLLPHGIFRARDGRPFDAPHWVINPAIAISVLSRAAHRENDIVIDYEHQTLYTEYNGQPAPAAGWFKNLEYRDGVGLFALDVDWTDRARGYIAAREYRYISAVFLYLPNTGEVLDILHAALTNFPAVDGMAEVTAQAAARFAVSLPNQQETQTVDKDTLELLGLDENPTPEQIKAAVAALKTSANQTADLQTQVAALKSGETNPNPEKFVPVAAVADLQAKVADLSAKLDGNEVDGLVAAALKEGKLIPAMEQWARDLGKTNVAALKSYLEKAQPIAALKSKQTDTTDVTEGDKDQLDDVALAVCKQLGVTPEQYKKAAQA